MALAVFLLCLAVTVVVEGGIMFLLFRSPQRVYYSLLCNLLTNPALNLLLMLWGALVGAYGYYVFMAVLELAVLITEALVYRALFLMRFSRAVLLSGLLNGCSFAAGAVLMRLVLR